MSLSVDSKPEPGHPIDVANASLPPELAKSRYGKWRAVSLILVYVLMTIHILHWKVAGRTMAPLELSEIMKALEYRVLSAGVIFIGVMIVGSAIFGRFFCSWGCHMLAAQDLCHWILKKLRIRPRPVRSRVLLLVPLLAAGYMFVWPPFKRMLEGAELPEPSSRFATTDFWRDLPGPLVIALTFIVCGCLSIYLLGGRGFCIYGCPYGVLFGLVDRLSPGKIRSAPGCQQCGRCTAMCTSGVRVHEEVKAYGMVTDPRCLKDLDCVSVCPRDALVYRFGRPSLFRRGTSKPPRPTYDFSIPEEIAMVVVFSLAFLTWRDLYDKLPFLLSLALSALTAYLAISFARLFYRRQLTLNRYALKSDGRLLRAGYAFAASCGAFLLFVAHSAFIQYHKRTADYLLKQAAEATEHGGDAPAVRRARIERAIGHLETCYRYGLISTTSLEMRLGGAHLELNEPREAEFYLRRAVRRHPDYPESRIHLASALARNGRLREAASHLAHTLEIRSQHEEYGPPLRRLQAQAHVRLGALFLERNQYEAAEQHYRSALGLEGQNVQAHFGLGFAAAQQRRYDDAVGHYRNAVRIDPGAAEAHANLGDVLLARNEPQAALDSYRAALAARDDIERVHFKMGVINYHLSRADIALKHFDRALETAPDDPELHNYRGLALMRIGREDEARRHFEKAISIDSTCADAHFNLGGLCARTGDRAGAERHLKRAAQLSPRYAEWLVPPRSGSSPSGGQDGQGSARGSGPTPSGTGVSEKRPGGS